MEGKRTFCFIKASRLKICMKSFYCYCIVDDFCVVMTPPSKMPELYK